MPWWWLLLMAGVSCGLLGLGLLADKRWQGRHPKVAKRIAAAHRDAELVEHFDRLVTIRAVPVGDLTWATMTGDVYLIDCAVDGCDDVWLPPYATEEAALDARSVHVGEHVVASSGWIGGGTDA